MSYTAQGDDLIIRDDIHDIVRIVTRGLSCSCWDLPTQLELFKKRYFVFAIGVARRDVVANCDALYGKSPFVSIMTATVALVQQYWYRVFDEPNFENL